MPISTPATITPPKKPKQASRNLTQEIENDLPMIRALPRVGERGDVERQRTDRPPQRLGQPQPLPVGFQEKEGLGLDQQAVEDAKATEAHQGGLGEGIIAP